MGGIAGGAIGNSVGKGSGRGALTVIGVVGGAVLGNKIEGGPKQSNTQNVQRCATQTFYENRPTAYNVVYEFNGKQYQVQLPNDPGSFVSLQVTPVGGQPIQPAPVIAPAPVIVRPVTQAPVYTQPVIVETSTVYVQQPQVVYVRPAPVYVAPAYGYGRPHAHSHLHPHLQPQHLAYPANHHRQPRHGSVVSMGYTGHYR
jgi:hypothetical protein